jgi:LPXTG-motif cell wall-anchored protein
MHPQPVVSPPGPVGPGQGSLPVTGGNLAGLGSGAGLLLAIGIGWLLIARRQRM